MKIFDELSSQDRKNFGQTCKNFLRIYHNRPGKHLYFNMSTECKNRNCLSYCIYKCGKDDLKNLLNLKHTPVVGVMISNYCLIDYHSHIVGDKHYDELVLLDKPLQHYLDTSLACKTVQLILLDNVICSLDTIETLAKLFPRAGKQNIFIKDSTIEPLEMIPKFHPVEVLSLEPCEIANNRDSGNKIKRVSKEKLLVDLIGESCVFNNNLAEQQKPCTLVNRTKYTRPHWFESKNPMELDFKIIKPPYCDIRGGGGEAAKNYACFCKRPYCWCASTSVYFLRRPVDHYDPMF